MLVSLRTTCAANVLICAIMLPGMLMQSHNWNASVAVPFVRVHAVMLTSRLCQASANALPGKQ